MPAIVGCAPVNGLSPVLRSTFIGFAGLALIAGALLFIGATETDDWFSWTIEPPLSAAAMGAFYWAAFALFLVGLSAREWAAARSIAYPVLAIALALLIVTLIHLERFDMDSLFGVFWLCAYIVAPPLLILGIVSEERRGAGALGGPELPPPLRAALLIEGALMLATSALMLLAPDRAAEIWPWALTPLTSRVLGTFTLAVALVALIVVRENRLSAVTGMAAAYSALGALQLLAVALHSGDLGDDGLATAVYLGFLVAILLTGLYGAATAARASSRS
jgi:hypothetical protein